MPYCKVVDDVSLYYEDLGAGPAVVLTPGGQLTHKMWESQVAALGGESPARGS
ncbi:MAG: alpha/beta fold hydrolase [Alphaproteobacteria bacterium]